MNWISELQRLSRGIESFVKLGETYFRTGPGVGADYAGWAGHSTKGRSPSISRPSSHEDSGTATTGWFPTIHDLSAGEFRFS